MELPSLSMLGTGSKNADIAGYVGFAIPAVAILASFAIGFFVVWPKFQEVMQLRSSNRELVTLNATLNQKANGLEKLDKADLRSDYSLAEQMMPSDKAIFLLLRQIELTANTNGVVLNSMSVTPGHVGTASANTKSTAPPSPPGANTAAGLDVTEIPVTMTIASDYRSLISFLSSIFAEPRVVTVTDLSSAASGTGTVTTSISMTSYWQSLPTTLGSIDSPVSNLTAQETERLKKAETSPISVGTSLPSVPVGRSDLFSPFQ